MDLINSNNGKKEDNNNFLKQRYSEIISNSSNKNNLGTLIDEQYKRKLSSIEIKEVSPINKKEKSLKYYNKFVNGIKKISKKNIEFLKDNEGKEGNEKFIKLMMDKSIINKDSRHSNKITENNNEKNINQNKFYEKDKNEEYIKKIILIQRKFREYKNKKNYYDELTKQEMNFLSFKEIKDKNKEDLQIELIKSINRNKDLYNIIKFYKYKINYLESGKKNYKNLKKNPIFVIENQENLDLMYNKSNNIKSKENKAILKSSKNGTKIGNKRVTIIDIKDKHFLLNNNKNEYNNNNITNIKTIKKDSNDIRDSSKNVCLINNENNINNNNNNLKDVEIKSEDININDKKDSIEEDVEEKKARLKKSRGLRKLLNKKVQEKKEMLKKYFRKFYLAGIMVSIRLGVRKKTLEEKELKLESNRAKSHQNKIKIANGLFNNNYLLQFTRNDDEEEEIDINIKRRNELLTKIIYRKDRICNLILKQSLQKLNLRVKLLSLNSIKKERLAQSKSKSKAKKKTKNKSKSVTTIKNTNIKK